MRRGATFSPCGTYRYDLTRAWDLPPARAARNAASTSACTFVMLNPSTADGVGDDPTVRRCVGFARAWGYGGIRVLNLFALRAADPRALRAHPDPVGPDNDRVLREASRGGGVFVCAWGAAGWPARARAVRAILGAAGGRLRAIRLTRDGHPAHPLYLPGDLLPVPFAEGSAPPPARDPAAGAVGRGRTAREPGIARTAAARTAAARTAVAWTAAPPPAFPSRDLGPRVRASGEETLP